MYELKILYDTHAIKQFISLQEKLELLIRIVTSKNSE